jgi:superoxide reductase
MTAKNQIYKCSVCGNIVEVIHNGTGQLVCCGQPMELMEEKEKEEGLEKHVPIIEEMAASICQGKDGFRVKVGEVPHPMEEKHYIEWIEIVPEDGKRGKKFLKPGDKPEVEFYTRKNIIGARAYCNVHGLWKST